MRPKRNGLGLKRLALLTVAACLGTAVAQRPVTVSGTIPNPTAKSGTIVAWAGYFDMSPTGAIAFGEVTADGNFSFDLPGQIRGDVLHPVEAKNICQAGGQDLVMEPRSTTHVLVNTLMAFDTSSTPVLATLASSRDLLQRLSNDKADVGAADALGYYFYVDRAIRIRGSCVSADGLSVTYDVNAAVGWNLLAYTFEEQGGVVTGKIATVRSFPPQLGWVSSVE